MEIELKNNTFELCPQKVILWRDQNTLLVSDLHIGKIAHFRKAGIALPHTAIQENFNRLDHLLAYYPIERIIFIGDLFHSDINIEWKEFYFWRRRYSRVNMDIVPGNHDRLPASFFSDYDIAVHSRSLDIGPFTFAHHPQNVFRDTDQYVFSGHIHPLIRISGLANQSLRLPCFYFGAQQAILPSFGYFTGGHRIHPSEKDLVVAIANDRLVKVCPR